MFHELHLSCLEIIQNHGSGIAAQGTPITQPPGRAPLPQGFSPFTGFCNLTCLVRSRNRLAMIAKALILNLDIPWQAILERENPIPLCRGRCCLQKKNVSSQWCRFAQHTKDDVPILYSMERSCLLSQTPFQDQVGMHDKNVHTRWLNNKVH
ncbi:hypothetical protein D1007_33846 [Hordeum vulgare]|nr:hypothetical protein D1007_33846 [Hordeum vulgare]